MTLVSQQLRDLVALTQSYLFQELRRGQSLVCDEEAVLFYGTETAKTEEPLPAAVPIKEIVEEVAAQPVKESVPQLPCVATPEPIEQRTAAPSQVIKVNVPKVKNEGIPNLEPLAPSVESDLSDIVKILKKVAPDKPLRENVPSDQKALRRSQQWKKQAGAPAIIILAFDEAPPQRAFLANLAQAAKLLLAPAVLYSAKEIEEKKGWSGLFEQEELRLVVCGDYGMYELPELMKHYRESPTRQHHYLGGIKTLLLSDPSLYLKQPLLKASLWKALTTVAVKTATPQ